MTTKDLEGLTAVVTGGASGIGLATASLVLSSLLGISLTSALKWTRRAGRDWNTYLASRV